MALIADYSRKSILFDECTPHLISDRLEHITHHAAAAGLHKDFGRHAGNELLTVETSTLFFGECDSDCI